MTGRSRIISLVVVLVVCAVSPAPAGVIGPDLRLKLDSLRPEEEVSVIVTLADQVNLQQFADKDRKIRRARMNRALRAKAEKTQQPLKDFLQQMHVGNVRPFWIFNGMAVTMRADLVEKVADRPGVQSVRLDAVHSLSVPLPSRTGTPEWNLQAINAPALWELGFTGEGVVVAAMDTGVDYLHPDIGPKWRGGANSWFNPHDPQSGTPYDNAGIYSGHGTAVMGIMVGGDAGGTSIGVAPGARWIAVKLYDDTGSAALSDFHAGFEWLLDPDGNPDTDDLPDVVNNSWGFDTLVDGCEREFQADVRVLKAAGVAVVFSAGNAGPLPATSISPANYPEGFAAGMVNEALQIGDYSSRGPSACDGTVFPEIVAPGVQVRSAGLTCDGAVPDSYGYFDGTSFAAPHVTGAMALLLDAAPLLGVEDLESLLQETAADLGDAGADNNYGSGLLDVRAAACSLFDIYSLTVAVDGKGTVSSDPPGIDCRGDCEKESLAGTTVTLTAVPGPDSTFTGWAGDCTGMETTCEVLMDRVKNVTAGFYSFPWNLFVPGLINRNGRE